MPVIGFIGTGNMGGALARAAARSGQETELLLSNRTREKAERLCREIGGRVTDALTAAAEADWLFLGVKPHMMADLVASIRGTLDAREKKPVAVSMAAGTDLARLKELLGSAIPVIRIMPNTPAAVGEGVTLWTAGDTVTEAQKEEFRAILAASGTLSEVDERLMEAGAGLTGCGPAYACMFMEALADGAVACGLPRKLAVEYAARTLLGTAKLLLETGEHPGALKDAVCSPGGSTIQGVRALERGGFRSAVTEAVIAAYEKKF